VAGIHACRRFIHGFYTPPAAFLRDLEKVLAQRLKISHQHLISLYIPFRSMTTCIAKNLPACI
jgi:hypothetical protein